MAHGYLQTLGGPSVDVYSAGIHRQPINPAAVVVMSEDGIDISQFTSNVVDEYKDIDFDFVLTVCDEVREVCPVFPAKVKVIHASFEDPAALTVRPNDLTHYRKVRDDIRNFVGHFITDYVNVSS